jgi:hypothetical protein
MQLPHNEHLRNGPRGATAANVMDISPSVSLVGALSESRMGSFAALKMSLRREHHRLRDRLRQRGSSRESHGDQELSRVNKGAAAKDE